MTELTELIKKRIVFFDGGLGSLLQSRGLAPGELPETWNIKKPWEIVRLHREYLEAGADIVTANTFGANALKYGTEKECSVEEIVSAGIRCAKQAVEEAVKEEIRPGKKGFVALDLGPTGKLLKPLGDLDFEEACRMYGEAVRTGVREGADLILVETMSDGYEAKAAVLAAKENSRLPVFATMVFDERGKLLTGGTPESAVALLEGLGVDALGVNCGLGPVQMRELVERITAAASVPVIVNPNAGLPRSENGETVYDIGPEEFAAAMEELAGLGAGLLGGCCGTTPEHIRLLASRCGRLPARVPEKKRRTVISSYSHAVTIGEGPVIIGERINPTGKPKFKQALREHNLEYILREGVIQQEHGAHVLDVNVGLPEIDEPAMMEEAVRELQTVVDLPLQIDTSDGKAMERALRIYNGKALINSVNGKQEVMDEIFPLMKKYGGVAVALTLDESGIPDTAEGRVRIAERIYKRAEEYGIGRENILIDGLCMTVSSDRKGALTTLETVRLIKERLGGRTVLGVSNISFGLPQREHINAAFFTMALHSGLDAAIINPNSEAMMRSYYSFRALAGLDPHCGDYIAVYGGEAAGSPSFSGRGRRGNGIAAQDERSDPGQSLSEAVEKGLKEQAHAAAKRLLETREALDLINSEMIPALDRVGKGFEEGRVFLPQLLMSAEAAKAAFEVIKENLSESGRTRKKRGTIILATVKGDIHDIGKNIVKVLLENYSYDVIDLGKDVPPERIAEEAQARRAPLVGLSALMTTTVPSMEATIRLLRERAPWARVMVGGAVMTPEYASAIGADRYCKDAMASVAYAGHIFSGD